MKTYTALTIGPIIETLNTARKTRELWGGSYLFSYIIKQIVNKLNKNKIEVILPVCGETDENEFGAGLYPDRIFVVKAIDIEQVYLEVIKEISVKINIHLIDVQKDQNKLPFLSTDIETYLLKYIRFIQVQYECTGNIIEEGTYLLDAKELEAKIISVCL